jgi:hypothetical protein
MQSLQLVQPLYEDGFELVIIGFRDVSKTPTAAVAISEQMPGTPLFTITDVGICSESESILRKVSTRVMSANEAVHDLPKIVSEAYEQIFVSIRRADPLQHLTVLTERESKLLYCLQDRPQANTDLETATGMTKGVIDRAMRNLSEKMGAPNERTALAVASFRMIGDLRLTSTGNIFVPERPTKCIFY